MTGEIAVALSANAMPLLSGFSVLDIVFKVYALASLCNQYVFVVMPNTGYII
jgi:hypothetical protein